MKKNYKILFTAFTLSICSYVNAQTIPTPDILHYKFDGGASTSVTNYASSPPSGTATGTIMGAQTQTGSVNCLNALVGSGFASSTDYVNTGWVTNLGAQWTISFWTSNIQPSTTLYYIFGDINAGSFRCFTNGVAGANNWLLRGPFTDIPINGAATATSNMITVSYDQPAGKADVYINGVFTNSVTQTIASVTGTGPFKVGGYNTTQIGLSPGGLMADFRIYGSALTATQVASIYAETSTTAVTLSVTGNTTICAGESSTLTASGTSTSYSWNTSAITASISVTPTTTSNYSVTGSLGTCTAQSVYTVNVNALPSVIAMTSNTLICTGTPVNLSAMGATTYTWNTGSNLTTIAVSPTTTTTYTLMGTDANGCMDSTTITQNVSTCTNINNLSSNISNFSFLVYPNPSNGILNVELAHSTSSGQANLNENAKIEITNSLGEIVLTENLSIQHSMFNIHHFSDGIYFMKVISGNYQTTQRLVINK